MRGSKSKDLDAEYCCKIRLLDDSELSCDFKVCMPFVCVHFFDFTGNKPTAASLVIWTIQVPKLALNQAINKC